MAAATHGANVWAALASVRAKNPLVQCIANYVSMDLAANTLLAAGASPAMVHSAEEVEEFIQIAGALSVNIGTLSPPWVEGMRRAIAGAKEAGKPWVLDPVGVGATTYRTKICQELIAMGPTVIRGNASEILAAAGAATEATRGVDSSAASTDALSAAKQLATACGSVVAVSGAIDLITDGRRVLRVANGDPLLQKVTATGCSVTALIAVFLAANPELQPLEAAAYTLAYFGLAAQVAVEAHPGGPGTFRAHFLDALYALGEETVTQGALVSEDPL
ncbi:hydroxyethylthiazole kinase family protein [Klebsormidium nitens]|uniref:hydroxyethylthiazole kinase n=1 Tax=Klebsormidium nitens TaxID=105231 RepID=A0A1Y1HV19_KLENI|nr:hydroxyethylthiazole kinase family protein [Klebsormidium nitens]|eukprot:GAQ81662.1 hydroxyethylthiazole kinase family protein [Klebsormidium nitens]